MSKGYIAVLQDAFQHTHGCASRHVATVPIKEEFKGKVAWEGDVEVFDLIGHPKAAQGYAWGYQDDTGQWQCVAVLKVPPVGSPQEAGQGYILNAGRTAGEKP